jgi:hypothetical protein
MNVEEAARIITILSTADNRTLDKPTASAWALFLSDVSYSDAERAVVDLVNESREYITPKSIRDWVRQHNRQSAYEIAADVRAARARGIVSADWPDKQPLDSDARQKLSLARERDRSTALQYAIEE